MNAAKCKQLVNAAGDLKCSQIHIVSNGITISDGAMSMRYRKNKKRIKKNKNMSHDAYYMSHII